MALDILTFGEALVEVMRTDIDQPLDQPSLFTGPYPSGAPFIFAVQAARLGAKVGAIGAVGDDAFGKCLLDQLHADHVDTRGVHVLPDYTTGVAFVGYKADGSREFVFHARHAAAGQLSAGMLDAGLFSGLKCLHIMGSTLSMHQDALQLGLRALEMAQAAGAKISFDPNIRPQLMSADRARYAFAPFMAAADVLIPSEEELLLLNDAYNVDAVVQDMLEDKPELIVVITKGAAGCVVMTQSNEFYVPGVGAMMQVDPINGYDVVEVDPTGAGDCFDAGFLARWLAGDSPSEAAEFANACGALAVTAKGPMAGACSLAEVRSFMRENQPKEDKFEE